MLFDREKVEKKGKKICKNSIEIPETCIVEDFESLLDFFHKNQKVKASKAQFTPSLASLPQINARLKKNNRN